MMNNEQHNLPASAAHTDPFQSRVQPWMMACFGPEISADGAERNHRFLEESLELVQACGCTASEAHQLVDYVFGRPVGERAQEVGGVMVTLAALCLAQGLEMHAAGDIELARIWTKVEAIRAKQAAKPKHSPLPAAAPQVVADEHSELAYTAEEAREQFMDQVRHLVWHWECESRAPTAKEKLEGLVFSLLNIFDGTSGLPAFDIVCAPHPDDKRYHIVEGSRYYVPGMIINECQLHEMLFDGHAAIAAAPGQAQEPVAESVTDFLLKEAREEVCRLKAKLVIAESRAPVQPVAVPDGIAEKASYWFDCLDKCAKLLNLADDTPIPSGVVAAVEKLTAAPAAQGDAKDAERLRWMAESGARVSWSMDGEYCNVWIPAESDGTGSLPAEGYPQKCYDSWHRAIDAAIAAKAAS